MPNVLNEFAGDGVTRTFNFSMTGGYLSRDFVVFLTRPAGSLLDYTPYTGTVVWISDFTVEISDPIPVGTTFVITRRTPAEAMIDFKNTSRITEHNLDTAFGQSLHRTVELDDLTERRMLAQAQLADEAVAAAAGAESAARDSADSANVAQSLAAAAEAAAEAANNSAQASAASASAAEGVAEEALDLIQQAIKGNVDSFNARDGAVMPQAGDYSPQMVGFVQAGSLTPVPGFGAVPAWADPTVNTQAQALLNRTELLYNQQKRTALNFATLSEASSAAVALPDGQVVDVSENSNRYRVSSGALVLDGSNDQLRADLADSTKGASLVRSAAQFLPMSSRLQQDINNGLPVTPFHFTNGSITYTGSVDNSAALQEAINFVFGSFANPRMLDLCGRNWGMSSPLVYTTQPAAAAVIANGRLTALSNWAGGPMCDFRQPTEGPAGTATGFTMLNVRMNGGSLTEEWADGGVWLHNTHGCYFESCAMQYFSGHFIFDTTTRAATEVVVRNSRFNSRRNDVDCVRIGGYDSEVHGNIMVGFRNGVYSEAGGISILGNHIYDGLNTLNIKGGQAVVVGNYLDNNPVRLGGATPGSGVILVGNKFLRTTAGTYTEGGFIVVEPQAANTALNSFVATGNLFMNAHGAAMKMTAVNTANGSMTNGVRTRIDSNTTRGNVEYHTTTPRRAVLTYSTDTELTYSASLADQAPFGLPLTAARVNFEQSATGAAFPVVLARAPSGQTASARMSTASNGKLLFEGFFSQTFE